jgi:ABC-2 type transport system permease protein
MLSYLRLEMLQKLRDRSYFFLTLGFPVGLYLLQTNLVDKGWGAEGLPATFQFMVSMAAFGAMMTVLATGPRIARERSSGWLRQLRVTPLPSGKVVAAKIVAAMTLAVPVIVAVFVVAAINHGIALPAWRWAAMVALMGLGTAPFAALGVAVGYLFDPDSAGIVTSGALLVLLFLGGLIMQVKLLPETLQILAQALPSYRFADLAWSMAGAGRPEPASVALIFAWTAALATLALFAYRRDAITS